VCAAAALPAVGVLLASEARPRAASAAADTATARAPQPFQGARPDDAPVHCALEDAPLVQFRADLLDLAFDAASALPAQPHIKTRSRAQEAVVDACLELGQPRRALGCIERIDNWRRGSAYADLAFHLAQHGAAGLAQPYLDLALEIAAGETWGITQDWQRDQIRAQVARTLVCLGREQDAERLSAGVDTSQAGKVAEARALRSEPDTFEDHVRALDAVLASGGLDPVRNALQGCVRLFDRFYGETGLRDQAEARIRGSWGQLPPQIRFELAAELVEASLSHGDRVKAAQLTDEAQGVLNGTRWPPEDEVKLRSRVAVLRARADDAAGGRRVADAARAQFAAQRAQIVNIDRAGALRAVAEAYQALGDAAAAQELYKQAVEAGLENPNSRPRAEDLSSTCLSLALHGVEPDAALWQRLREVRAALGAPW
jgi:tetratricopeptide (TPR) repeat protein